MRSDDEIRADLAHLKVPGGNPHTGQLNRLARDARELLDRALTAERERDAALDRERQVIEQWGWQADRADHAETALDAVRADVRHLRDLVALRARNGLGTASLYELDVILAAAQPDQAPDSTPNRLTPDPWRMNHTIEVVEGFDGKWGAICQECSQAVQDYVYPCAEDRWPPVVPPHWLVAAPTSQPEPTPRLSHKRQIDLDMLLYGSAYEEVTATGRRRIDPAKFIMHIAPTSDSGEGEKARTPGDCPCWTCEGERRASLPWPEALCWPFIVCPTCGNKRCPKATHHDEACTGSNDSGQPGSRYAVPAVSQPVEESQQ